MTASNEIRNFIEEAKKERAIADERMEKFFSQPTKSCVGCGRYPNGSPIKWCVWDGKETKLNCPKTGRFVKAGE